MAHCMRASSGFGVLNRGLQHPGSSIRATTSARVDQASTKVKPSLTNPACKPQRHQVKVHSTSENVDQDKAVTKRKYRSHTKAAHIPEAERAAELKAIHTELVTDLGMEPEIASKVVKGAKQAMSKSVLSLENCRGWIAYLRKLGLDEKGMIQGLEKSPRILACSAAGREEENIEVLRVLEQAGLRSDQAAHIPKEERAAELEAIHKELVNDLGMEQEVASKGRKLAQLEQGLPTTEASGVAFVE
eukprot:gene6420-3043_t